MLMVLGDEENPQLFVPILELVYLYHLKLSPISGLRYSCHSLQCLVLLVGIEPY